MQYVHTIIAAASVFVLVRYSPFTLTHKILLSFSYYLFFEYSIVARNYALGVLLVFMACTLFRHRNRFPIVFAIVIFLLSHTSVFGTIFGFGMVLVVLAEYILFGSIQELARVECHRRAIAALIVLGGFGTAILQLSLPADSGLPTSWVLNPSIIHAGIIRDVFINAYMPMPNPHLRFWGGNPLLSTPLLYGIILVWLGFVVYVFCRFLYRRPSSLILYAVVSTGLCVFFATKFSGSKRHQGYLFIALIVALWIHRDCAAYENRFSHGLCKGVLWSSASKSFTTLLIVHVIAACIAISLDLAFPFSAAKETAAFLKSSGLESAEIIGDRSPEASAVAGYLSHKLFYYPDAQRFGSFIRWDNRRTQDVNTKRLYDDSRRLAKDGQRVVFVLSRQLSEAERSALAVKRVFESRKSVVGEDYFVYLLDLAASAMKER